MLSYRLAKGKDVHCICAAIHAAAMQLEDGSDELNALMAWHWQFFHQLAKILAVSMLLVIMMLAVIMLLLHFTMLISHLSVNIVDWANSCHESEGERTLSVANYICGSSLPICFACLF